MSSVGIALHLTLEVHLLQMLFCFSFQLERLQSENASEWGKREIIDAEKQGLKRENRMLKAQVKEIQELVDRKNELAPSNLGSDSEMAQNELLKKNKV